MAEKKEAKRITVTAVKNEKKTWKHKGEAMTAGDTAEVTEAQAARLKEQGLIK